jgi:hypothetical protein
MDIYIVLGNNEFHKFRQVARKHNDKGPIIDNFAMRPIHTIKTEKVLFCRTYKRVKATL